MDPPVLKQIGVYAPVGSYDVWAAAHLGLQNPAGNATTPTVVGDSPFVVQFRIEGDSGVDYLIEVVGKPAFVTAETMRAQGTHTGSTNVLMRFYAEPATLTSMEELEFVVTIMSDAGTLRVPVAFTAPSTNEAPLPLLAPVLLAAAALRRR